MLEEDDKKIIPTVEFTFKNEGKSEEEIKKEVAELLNKRNEILASMGISVPINYEKKEDGEKNDYPRHHR